MGKASPDYKPSDKIIRLPNGEYYGRRDLWLESFGELHTDIYNLSTAIAVWCSPADAMKYPEMSTPHPVWSFLHMEKRTVKLEYGICRTVGEYAGFEGTPVPITEFSTGVSEEPIQTHPDFAAFAGTPSAPLNNAVWVDPDGKVTTDNAKGAFDKFAGTGAFAGITSYLNPVLVKRRTTLSQGPVSQALVGHLDGGMLKVLASSVQRGIVFQNTEEWRGGGRRGINSSIYS
jgi:hypothetical protein